MLYSLRVGFLHILRTVKNYFLQQIAYTLSWYKLGLR